MMYLYISRTLYIYIYLYTYTHIHLENCVLTIIEKPMPFKLFKHVDCQSMSLREKFHRIIQLLCCFICLQVLHFNSLIVCETFQIALLSF